MASITDEVVLPTGGLSEKAAVDIYGPPPWSSPGGPENPGPETPPEGGGDGSLSVTPLAFNLTSFNPATMEYSGTLTGGEQPYTMDYGDGSDPDVGFTGAFSHIFTAAGTYTVTAHDMVGTELSDTVDVAAPAPSGDTIADPWDDMTTHAAIDAFANDPANGITLPDDWSPKTIAQKKAWLDDNA